MTDYEAYEYYLTIRTHFTSKSFNAFVNRKTKTSIERFMERNDNKLFGIVARKFEEPRHLIRFLVANISVGFFEFLYDLERAANNLRKWEIYKSNIKYSLFSDLSIIELHMLKNKVSFEEATWKCYLGKSLNNQSIYLIDKFTNLFEQFDKSSIFLFQEDILRIQKLEGFVKIPNNLETHFNNKLKDII